jgi:hemoglobin/transferrin/lactoferrin receptor protein
MVVSASRDEQDADSLPMTVDVIDAKQMEESRSATSASLPAKLPNVTVPRSPARFTLAGSPPGVTRTAASISVAWKATAC